MSMNFLVVAYLWGFDPREVKTKNICVWHASDDTACPREIGAWLARYYKEKGAYVNFKNDNIGHNHMTFCNSYYRQTENSMAKALLEGAAIHKTLNFSHEMEGYSRSFCLIWSKNRNINIQYEN